MKKFLGVVSIMLGAGALALSACGDSSGDDGGGGSASTSAGNTSGGDSTTSGQMCSSSHVCVNDVCNCGDDGKGKSCTDDSKCQAECQVCQ